MMATIPPFVKSGQRFTATHMVEIKMKKRMRLQLVAAGALIIETKERLDLFFVFALNL